MHLEKGVHLSRAPGSHTQCFTRGNWCELYIEEEAWGKNGLRDSWGTLGDLHTQEMRRGQ